MFGFFLAHPCLALLVEDRKMPNLAIPRKQRKNIAQSWEGKKTTHISNLPRTVNGGKLSNDNHLPLL